MTILKKINAWLHLWLGLASGIIVFIVALTGCILVFEQEFKSLTQPWLHAERPANAPYLLPSVIREKVSPLFPEKEISGIWYYGHEKTAKVSMNSDSSVFVNPYDGKVVAIVHEEDFFHWVLEGHTELWIEAKIGETGIGETIVSYATLIFFILLITGLILWWPKKWNKSNRDKSFKIKWSARFKRINYDLHNVLGFYSLLVALIITITGLSMSFAWMSKSIYWLSSAGGMQAPYVKAVSDTTKAVSNSLMRNVDIAFQKGITEIGTYNKDAIIVSFPDELSEPIPLCTDMYNGSWRYVYLDQHTLKELPSTQVHIDKLKLADWLRRTNYALHVGAIGNLPTKILYFLASLICATLPITGFYVWWGRSKWGRSKKGKKLKPSSLQSQI
ncbi:PepSY-associated TM helix domain-containing protein [Dyadobacter sp. LHD-138]|uniref:PepSY-associated TM helix domain-containing protein n=1 Tax=Dyadobacter sp. LHD-138 TaxID=3071413 RepID=UPI0027DEDAC1|nr:PepSY-associated TM helix domain-containing protein [Dyadobacter sp. LHD-138]MDQ6480031.1 PepSY-associated TM helix domain-containing protein [Dyadobacter sp. LHD-138]